MWLLRAGADPDRVVDEQRAVDRTAIPSGRGNGATAPGAKPVAATTSSGLATRAVPRPDRPGDLLAVGPAVARDQRDDGAAVADEDQGLDDLGRVDAGRLRGCLGSGRALRELLQPSLRLRGREEVRDALDGLRPHRQRAGRGTNRPRTRVR